MGKLFHKLIHGLLPSCLVTTLLKRRASSRRLPYFKLRPNLYKPVVGASLHSPSPSSSSPPASTDDHGAAPYHLMEIDESTYYYSYSEDDWGINFGMEGVESAIEIASRHDNDNHYYSQEHDLHHHHHSHLCQQHEDPWYHENAQGKIQEDSQYLKPHGDGCGELEEADTRHGKPHGDEDVQRAELCGREGGGKRKSLELDENGEEEVDNKPKRQRREDARCELPFCIREMVGEGSAIVKYTRKQEEPPHAFWESMVEMIVSNGLMWDVGRQESILLCYLTLNDPHLYTTICHSFIRAIQDIHSALEILGSNHT